MKFIIKLTIFTLICSLYNIAMANTPKKIPTEKELAADFAVKCESNFFIPDTICQCLSKHIAQSAHTELVNSKGKINKENISFVVLNESMDRLGYCVDAYQHYALKQYQAKQRNGDFSVMDRLKKLLPNHGKPIKKVKSEKKL